MSDQIVSFINELRELVRNEALENQTFVEEIWSWPIEKRVASGYALDRIKPEGVTESGSLGIRVANNLSRFREGDALFLGRGNPRYRTGLPVTLEQENDDRLLFSIRNRKNIRDVDEMLYALTHMAGWSLELDFEDLSHFYLSALEDATTVAIGRERVLPLLLGLSCAQTDTYKFDRASEIAKQLNLDCAQSEALALAYSSSPAWLIQGPPGTGKTYLLAQLVKLLVEDGERVLVTSFTHRAINNALSRIKSVAPDVPIAKIGSHSQAPQGEPVIENFEYFGSCPLAERESGYVVGGTPFAVRSDRLSQTFFDTIIFDEASQITLPLAIMAMLAGNRYVFFGDHRQLPPVFLSKKGAGSQYRSVFSLLTEREMESMLTTSYRLNNALASWPSKTFYNSRLISAPAVRNRQIHYESHLTRWANILDHQKEIVFVETGSSGATTRNFAESMLATKLVQELLECGVPARELAIVVPYRAQARLVKQQLMEVGIAENLRREIVADTVERLQGQERECVIFSLTTARPSFAKQIGEFFFQPERLNVSITRARSKLIILGSQSILRLHTDNPELAKRIALFADFINTAHSICAAELK